jgi:hypothetical protein
LEELVGEDRAERSLYMSPGDESLVDGRIASFRGDVRRLGRTLRSDRGKIRGSFSGRFVFVIRDRVRRD